MSFCHLHVHSEYSLLDGACRIPKLIDAVKASGQTACAITDHGVMYGAVNFYKEAQKAGIHPVIGCEVYVAARSRFDRERELDSARYHLVLLCENEDGYKNLCRLVSRSFTEGFYTKPRVDKELLRKYSKGLIALSACLAGEIPRALTDGNYSAAVTAARDMRDIFGENNFFLELQNHGIEEQSRVNAGLKRLSRELGIPLVATNDVHYITAADADVQDVLLCIQTGKSVDDPQRMRFETRECYLKTEEEMRALFPDTPEAVDNTAQIADRCRFDFVFGKYQLPEFRLPPQTTSAVFLRRKCLEGLSVRYGPEAAKHREQLEYELSMIEKMGFTDYFLIVWDFVNFAKKNGIPVGPGRGSAAGSIVSYCLAITDIDPVKYNLYFERFLNPERVSMPDIDMDFCERRRGEVIEYVKRKYGEDRVAQIVTFNTLKAKNAVRNVSKAMGLSFAEENALAKEIPSGPKVTIEDALKGSKNLRELYETDGRIKSVIDTALALEDMPKDSGTHAAGVVITKKPVSEYVPLTLSKKDGSIATQYVMTTLEELGLLKMDFLGLRTLTVIDDAVRMIRRHTPDFSIENAPEDDPETYRMLTEGKTSGVFQLESAGITSVCTGLGPRSIEDLTAIIALYRPGPMDSIPRFLKNNKNPSEITYKHELLRPILDVTYGCIVYQEQVIEIFRRLAGFSLGQADMIRRAMSKKKLAEIKKERNAFIYGDPGRNIEGALARGVSEETASDIYDEINDFANYAFNKSHAVCYAVVCYRTAYLKCHYPQEFMASLMSSVLGLPEKVAEYTGTCLDMGIRILPPDVNESDDSFTVSGTNLRYGLAAVKNIGAGLIRTLMRVREEGGKFISFEDFCERMYGTELNKRAVESLIKCGGFDSLGIKRKQLMQVYERVIDHVAEDKRGNLEGQIGLFGTNEEKEDFSFRVELPDVEEFTHAELLTMERDVTGLYLSGHPMDAYREKAAKAGCEMIGTVLRGEESGFGDGQRVKIAGVCENVRTKATKNGGTMAYVTLADASGTIELLVFQKTLDKCLRSLEAGALLTASGRVSVRDENAPQLMADDILPITALGKAEYNNLEKNEAQAAPKLWIRFSGENDARLERVDRVLQMFPGNDTMIQYFANEKTRKKAFCLIHDAFVAELKDILGEENVVIK